MEEREGDEEIDDLGVNLSTLTSIFAVTLLSIELVL